MIQQTQFDTAITHRGKSQEIDFYFQIEHAIAPHNFNISIKECESREPLYRYKVLSYLYGRICVERKSFFAEVVGYIDPSNKETLVYHIVNIDKSFNTDYEISYSESAFSEFDNFEFL